MSKGGEIAKNIVYAISPKPGHPIWIRSEDEVIYYTFYSNKLDFLADEHKLSAQYKGGMKPLSEEEKSYARKIIEREMARTKQPVKELVFEDQGKANMFMMGIVTGHDFQKRTVVIGSGAPSLEDQFNKDGKVTNGGRCMYIGRENEIMVKYAFLPEKILERHKGQGAEWMLLHEVVIHGIGGLKHPVRFMEGDDDYPPFMLKDPGCEEGTMASYCHPEVNPCLDELGGHPKDPSDIEVQDCRENYPKLLTRHDIAAINRQYKLHKSWRVDTTAISGHSGNNHRELGSFSDGSSMFTQGLAMARNTAAALSATFMLASDSESKAQQDTVSKNGVFGCDSTAYCIMLTVSAGVLAWGFNKILSFTKPRTAIDGSVVAPQDNKSNCRGMD